MRRCINRFTKALLEVKLYIIEHQIRRYRRAFKQINIDVEVKNTVNVNIERNVNPHEKVHYVLKYA